jgi:putative DeoR family transcriptional regulator, stage III sporulation protein D
MRNSEVYEQRVIDEALYILSHNSTVRETANYFKLSKSAIHRDLSSILRELDLGLWKEVQNLFEHNISVRGERGGLSTRRKYQSIREGKADCERRIIAKLNQLMAIAGVYNPNIELPDISTSNDGYCKKIKIESSDVNGLNALAYVDPYPVHTCYYYVPVYTGRNNKYYLEFLASNKDIVKSYCCNYFEEDNTLKVYTRAELDPNTMIVLNHDNTIVLLNSEVA